MLGDLIKEVKHHHHHEEECCCGNHEHHHHHEEECCCGNHEHHHHHEEECCCSHHEHHHHEEECSCGHHEHHHDEECSCGHHHHHAEEVFNSIGLETSKVYNLEELTKVLNDLANSNSYGEVIRAKGIIRTDLGWKKFNITPNELKVEDNEAVIIGKVCVIGTHLDEKVIKGLF
jgi:hypothetical protein